MKTEMDFRLETIGKRFREVRKNHLGYSNRDAFCKFVGINSHKLSDIENGKCLPDYDILLKMKNECWKRGILDIDLGYMLDLYDSHTKDIEDTVRMTGLSEEAINTLIQMRHTMVHDRETGLNRTAAETDILSELLVIGNTETKPGQTLSIENNYLAKILNFVFEYRCINNDLTELEDQLKKASGDNNSRNVKHLEGLKKHLLEKQQLIEFQSNKLFMKLFELLSTSKSDK